MIPGIRDIPRDSRRGPFCVAKIHVPAVDYTSIQLDAVRWRKAKGIPRDNCGQPAILWFEGDNLCARHAGERALELLRAPAPRRQLDVIDVRREA